MSLFLFSSYAFVTAADSRQLMLHTYAVKIIENGSYEIVTKTLPLLILVFLTGIVSFINIFFFNKRVLQIRICFITVIMIFAQLVLAFFYYTSARNEYQAIHSVLRLPMIMPIVSLVMLIMAYKGIKHDETLVNSYNRIR